MKLIIFLTIGALFAESLGISSSWRPVLPAHTSTSILHQESIFGNAPTQTLFDLDGSHLLGQSERDRCTLYKVAMKQELYFEYIHYKMDMPDMKEFTLCMWSKFNNHSNDHPLFSYAVGDQPRGILAWVANTARSSYYMMNVDGHNLYRLNYPLRLNKWYHSCQSWNGRTGEWQIWVNDERVGRGFNNRLVGHIIKGGGIAITGQEQRQLGGGFLEGEGAPQGSGGLLGEITMVQLYGVALTAGKAHKDHKHHHAHHYEHDTTNNTPRPTTRAPTTGLPLPQNPYLTGGQINTQVKINPGAPLQIVRGGLTLRHPAIVPRDPPPPQSFPPANPDSAPTAFPVQFFRNLPQQIPSNGLAGTGFSFSDGPYHNLFKREKASANAENENAASTEEEGGKALRKRETDSKDAEKVTDNESDAPAEKVVEKRDSEKKKRGLIQLEDGLIIDDGYSIPQGLENDYFTGLASFGLQLPKYTNKDDEREPAEAEVKMIMDICDGCADEPFEKALIMAWRSVPKKLYSGALHLPAVQACKAF